MRYQIPAPSVPALFPYAKVFNDVGAHVGVSPILLASHAFVETLCEYKADDARTYMSYDGGRGLFQLTSSWPDNWRDPATSAIWAADKYIIPALETWNHDYDYTGDTLIKCEAATYNAGLNAALRGHYAGDVGKYTTYGPGIDGAQKSYADRVLEVFAVLVQGNLPPLPA